MHIYIYIYVYAVKQVPAALLSETLAQDSSSRAGTGGAFFASNREVDFDSKVRESISYTDSNRNFCYCKVGRAQSTMMCIYVYICQ